MSHNLLVRGVRPLLGPYKDVSSPGTSPPESNLLTASWTGDSAGFLFARCLPTKQLYMVVSLYSYTCLGQSYLKRLLSSLKSLPV